jgi:hypothetical protein
MPGTCRIEYGSDTRAQTDGNMRDSLEKGTYWTGVNEQANYVCDVAWRGRMS